MSAPWMVVAKSQLGVSEIPGPKHSSVILGWLESLKAWWRDDETPWCGVFVAYCLMYCRLPVAPNWMRAKSWVDYGERLVRPVPGCIVVFERQGGGHVGFVVGETHDGRLLVLGGNQGNRVSYAPFERSRVVAYVWPSQHGKPDYNELLPVMSVSGPSSSNET